MTSLWFVTPAWRRFELSGVCFEQRARVIETLALTGVEARCVVIADDENLDIARSFGFDTVERNNDWLGRKFNDGIEYAGKHGADFIVPIGSDSWIDPNYFSRLESGNGTRTSRLYAVVTGDRLAELRVANANGAGPYVFRRSLFTRSGFRPANDLLRKNIDSSTVKGIGQPIRWERHELYPLQYIGFRGTPHLTRYGRLFSKWGVRELSDPWEALADHYPLDLVNRAKAALNVAVAA